MTPAQIDYVRALVRSEVAKAYQQICAEIADLRTEVAALRVEVEQLTGEPSPLRVATAAPPSRQLH
jgi:cell division septum initiation protein DivIVA